MARRGVEEVARAGAGAVVVVEECPDDGGGAADRDGPAKMLLLLAVVGQELGDLLASGRVKDIGRPGVVAVILTPVGPDDGGSAVERDGMAESVVLRAVVGQEFGNLLAREYVEQVGGAGVGAVVVVPHGPDHGGGAADRDGPAEQIVRRAVVG